MMFSPLSLAEVARRRRALQPFWSPQGPESGLQRDENEELEDELA